MGEVYWEAVEKDTCISVGAGVCIGCCVCMWEAVMSQELCWCGRQ